MECPICNKKLLVVSAETGNQIHPAPEKDEPDCPVMYFSLRENKIYYKPGYVPELEAKA